MIAPSYWSIAAGGGSAVQGPRGSLKEAAMATRNRHPKRLAALAAAVLAAGCSSRTDAPSSSISTPIIHIGANSEDPKLMETAILLVIATPFDTVKKYVSNPANIENYIAFAAESRAEPFAGGPEGDLLVNIEMTVADVFGVSISGKPLALRWHPQQADDSIFAVAFEKVSGAYEHLTGNIYAANLFDGSTAVMLRTTTRTGFLPEAVREKLARWHAEASIAKLTALLDGRAAS
jgi:hypothetical protein